MPFERQALNGFKNACMVFDFMTFSKKASLLHIELTDTQDQEPSPKNVHTHTVLSLLSQFISSVTRPQSLEYGKALASA